MPPPVEAEEDDDVDVDDDEDDDEVPSSEVPLVSSPQPATGITAIRRVGASRKRKWGLSMWWRV
jgi:hypothetical protein